MRNPMCADRLRVKNAAEGASGTPRRPNSNACGRCPQRMTNATASSNVRVLCCQTVPTTHVERTGLFGALSKTPHPTLVCQLVRQRADGAGGSGALEALHFLPTMLASYRQQPSATASTQVVSHLGLAANIPPRHRNGTNWRKSRVSSMIAKHSNAVTAVTA